MTCPPANIAWLVALTHALASHQRVSPRGQICWEVTAQRHSIDMENPVITIPERELNYRFMIEEALWILEGRNNIFHKNMAPFSDNGRILQGAYGPPISEQLEYVCKKLVEDEDTRQAVINIWRNSPRDSRDIPCTLSLQFLQRERCGVYGLDLIVSMRSSDLWLGFPYDIFSFTMVAMYVLLICKPRGTTPHRLGGLFLTAGSSHIYEKDIEKAIMCTKTKETGSKFNMNLYGLDTPDDLLNYLRELRDDKGVRDKALGLT